MKNKRPEKKECNLCSNSGLGDEVCSCWVVNNTIDKYDKYVEELLGGLKEDYINGTKEGVLVEVVLIAKQLNWDEKEGR